MKCLYIPCFTLVLFLFSCGNNKTTSGGSSTVKDSISDDSLLTLVQQRTFNYFWEGAEPNSGLARERIHMDGEYPQNDQDVVTVGGGGFGIMAILVGVERKFITREEAVSRLSRVIGFLQKADRFHGAWPHWLDGKTGEVKAFSKKDDGGDLVETAFMAQGLICVSEYFRNGNVQEKQLADQADSLWKSIDWNWYRKGGENVLYWHWSPKYGWEMNFPVTGYNECLIMYVLAAASPTHGVPEEVYHEGWAKSGGIKSDEEQFGYKLVLGHNGSPGSVGPLFWAHYSYLGLDPTGLKDKYADYWTLNKNHTLINRAYAIQNPKGYKGYGEKSWGFTASYSVNGYAGHRPGEDLGVISPTAAISSYPYTPEYSMQVIRHLHDNMGNKVWGKYGFYDAFSETEHWYPQRYLAIDQGPEVVMIENGRSGLLWKLFMKNEEVQKGLKKLGFESPHLKR